MSKFVRKIEDFSRILILRNLYFLDKYQEIKVNISFEFAKVQSRYIFDPSSKNFQKDHKLSKNDFKSYLLEISKKSPAHLSINTKR